MKTTKDGAVIFDKEDLIEKLGFTEEQSERIIKYQKTLPILSGTKGTKVNARDLWIQLGETQGDFSHWINRKVVQKGFEKGKDYFIVKPPKEVNHKTVKKPRKNSNLEITDSRNQDGNFDSTNLTNQKTNKDNRGGDRRTIEYTLTIDTAKNVAMMENTDIGRLTRDYYISMEGAIKDYALWQKEREPQKPVTIRIQKLLYNKYLRTFKVKPINNYFWTANMDMINLIAFGFRAAEINDYLERENDGKTREHLITECLERLTYLLEQHEVLLRRGFDFDTREHELIEMYKAKYANALNPFDGKEYPISYSRPTWWDMDNVV